MPTPSSAEPRARLVAARTRDGARRIAAVAILAGALAGCTTTGGRSAADEETCLAYGGPRGSDGYQQCLARLDAQARDEMLANRADMLVH